MNPFADLPIQRTWSNQVYKLIIDRFKTEDFHASRGAQWMDSHGHGTNVRLTYVENQSYYFIFQIYQNGQVKVLYKPEISGLIKSGSFLFSDSMDENRKKSLIVLAKWLDFIQYEKDTEDLWLSKS